MENKLPSKLVEFLFQKETHSISAGFLDSLEDSTKKIIANSTESSVVNDAYGNSLTATGTEDKVKSFSKYGFSNDTLNWPLWLALYQDSWVFKRAIDKPAQDMVRPGITLNLNDASKQDDVYRLLNKYRFDLIQLIQWGRLFGGSVAVMMFDNLKDDDYSKPLNKTAIKNAKALRLYVTDRWYGVAVINSDTVSDMKNLDFGKPKQYRITFADGKTLIVHHDYILRFEGRVAPKLVKSGQLQGWGYSEGSHIINELSRDDQLKSSITSLVNKSLIEVIKMSGMRGVFLGADSENAEQLQKRLEMVNWARNYNSLTFLDKDDEYQEHGFSGLSGLSDLLEKNMWLISAALEMQGILFGDLKNGFSNDVDALERYDETILNLNESYYRPVLEKFIMMIYLMLGIQEKVDFKFNSLLMKKQDEERMQGLKHFQELLSGMFSDGVITAKQYAKFFSDYTSKGIISFNFTEQELDALDDKISEEMENIDISNLDEEKIKEVK